MPAHADEVYLCPSSEVLDAERGLRFPVTAFGSEASGFVVRYRGTAYAYLNRCAHVPIELDWNPGDFFESSGLYLMCATHGALYLPENGQCAGGPCRGGRLRPIAVSEHDGNVYWTPDEYIRPPQA